MAQQTNSPKIVANSKRQKIKESNKMMFLWIAGMSVIVGFAAVTSIFLAEQIWFRKDIVSEKSKTQSTLESNIKAAEELQQAVRVLDTDKALYEARVDNDERSLQVILDALPADANSLALGASLQKKLIAGIPNLTLESLSVMPTASEGSADTIEPSEETVDNQINFRMTVTSPNNDALKALLERFEKSIRVIDIDELKLERSQSNFSMTIDGHAYYQPAKTIELREKVVKPAGSDKPGKKSTKSKKSTDKAARP